MLSLNTPPSYGVSACVFRVTQAVRRRRRRGAPCCDLRSVPAEYNPGLPGRAHSTHSRRVANRDAEPAAPGNQGILQGWARTGPIIVASHWNKSDWFDGPALQLAGGSLVRSASSLVMRFVAAMLSQQDCENPEGASAGALSWRGAFGRPRWPTTGRTGAGAARAARARKRAGRHFPSIAAAPLRF